MNSIVLELQRDASTDSISILNLLRKALIVSKKLGLAEFQQWIELELNGYNSQPIPEYRVIRGQLRAWNPYHGWQPIITDDDNLLKAYERACKCSVNQSISELVTLAESNKDELRIMFSPQVESFLVSSVGTSVKVEISRSSIRRILEAVRDVILKWSLKLEEDGITGQEMSFSPKERDIAAKHNYNHFIQINVEQTQMQNSSSESQSSSDSFSNDLRNANVANFANQVSDNARQQANQYNYTVEQQQNLTEAAAEIQQLLEQLSQTYSTDTVSGRMQVATETVSRIEGNANLTQRVISAIQAGGISALEQLLNHPAASFVIAALEDWQKTSDV